MQNENLKVRIARHAITDVASSVLSILTPIKILNIINNNLLHYEPDSCEMLLCTVSLTALSLLTERKYKIFTKFTEKAMNQMLPTHANHIDRSIHNYQFDEPRFEL